MAKIPFSIKYRPQLESGEYKVETRDGRPVRIICWDREPNVGEDKDLTLCVLIPRTIGEGVYYYNHYGKSRLDGRNDLFIITPEPELSEFEKALKECVNARNPENTMTDEGSRNNATILRAIALKEFKENEASYIKEFVEQKEKEAYEMGKAEALKDLPRWKKCALNTIKGVGGYIILNGYMINVDHLKKLPGFNE